MYIDALEVAAPAPKDVAGEVGVAGALASEKSCAPSRGGAPRRLRDAPPRDRQERRAIAASSGGLLGRLGIGRRGSLPGRPPRSSPPASGRLSSYVGRGVLVPFCIAFGAVPAAFCIDVGFVLLHSASILVLIL